MRKIENLDDTIFLIQFKRFIDSFETKMHKEMKTIAIKFMLFSLPVIALIVNFFTIKNPYILVASLITVSALGISNEIVDMIKSIRKDAQVDNEIKLDTREGSDFYSPQYVKILSEKKEKEAKVNLELIDNSYLEKEAAIYQVVREIEAYTLAYQLPPLKLSDANWDKLFDILYGIYAAKGMESQYYDCLSFLIRYVFSKVLLDGEKIITIDTFIENIDILNQRLTEDEIKYIQEEFDLSKKVVDFSKLQRKSKNHLN